MAINEGISTDMETTRDLPFDGSGQENGSYYFVKKPDQPLYADYIGTQQPKFQVDAPQQAADVNDISLDDISEGAGKMVTEVSEQAKSLYEGAKGLVGITPAPKPSTPAPQVSPAQQIKLPPQQGVTPSEKHIKNMQTYLQNPSTSLKVFLGGTRYTGEIDGKPGPKTNAVVNKLESALAQLLKTNEVYGTVMRATPDDVEQGVRLAAQYRAQPQPKSAAHRLSRDERVFKMAKILVGMD